MNIRSIEVSCLCHDINDTKTYLPVKSSLTKTYDDLWILVFPGGCEKTLDSTFFKEVLKFAISKTFNEWLYFLFSKNETISVGNFITRNFPIFYKPPTNILYKDAYGAELTDTLMLLAHYLLNNDNLNFDTGNIIYDKLNSSSDKKYRNKIIIPSSNLQAKIMGDTSFFERLKQKYWFFECLYELENSERSTFIYRPYNTIPLFSSDYDISPIENRLSREKIVAEIQKEYESLLQ